MAKRLLSLLLVLLLWALPALSSGEDAEVILTHVQQLIEAGRFGDAVTLLDKLAATGHERVAEYYAVILLKNLEANKMAEVSAQFKKGLGCPNAETLFLEPFYEKAVELSASGAHLKAFQVFTLLGSYKDSAARAAAAQASLYAPPATPTPASTVSPAPKPAATPTPASGSSRFAQAQVGQYITFGHYEQDNNQSNGPEPIQWRVLAKENNRLLLISRYGLVCRQYDRNTSSWKRCALRKWLNDDFISQAFSAEELMRILTTDVFTPNTHNGTKGDTTQDRVFLLSTQEAERYFSSDADRVCKATVYTKKQGATTVDGDICWWWLRSHGASGFGVVKIFTTGKIDYSGYNKNSTRGSIRPALWIELDP